MNKVIVFLIVFFISNNLFSEEITIKCNGTYKHLGDKKSYDEKRFYSLNVENNYFVPSQSLETIKKLKPQFLELLTQNFQMTDTYILNNFYDEMTMIETRLRLNRYDLDIVENIKYRAVGIKAIFEGKCIKVKQQI